MDGVGCRTARFSFCGHRGAGEILSNIGYNVDKNVRFYKLYIFETDESFRKMPKIADIQETPNPNAVKFILREPVSHGTSHSFKNREAASSLDVTMASEWPDP